MSLMDNRVTCRDCKWTGTIKDLYMEATHTDDELFEDVTVTHRVGVCPICLSRKMTYNKAQVIPFPQKQREAEPQ